MKLDGLWILNIQWHVQGGWEVEPEGLQGVAGIAIEDIIAQMGLDFFKDFTLVLAELELVFSV